MKTHDRKPKMPSLLLAGTLAVATVAARAAVPDPGSGGVAGKPINLLVVSSTANGVNLIDPEYADQLKAAGYNLRVLNHHDKLTAEYLNQFGCVILANLPYAGERYTVAGYKNRFVTANLGLIQDYIGGGGGVVLMPAISEFGEAYGWTYNEFLKPYDARLLIQQVKDGNFKQNQLGPGAYGAGSIQARHEIARSNGIGNGAKVLYPQNVMRWDHSYSCTPILTGRGWNVLATADRGAGTYVAEDNTSVGDQLTKNVNLYAVRQAGKGMLAVSAVHSYYTLTMISRTENRIGENGTGVIDWKAMKGEKGGRPSVLGQLLDNTYRCFAANAATHGVGAWAGLEKPAAPPLPESPAVIDWTTQPPPPTWAHRVIPSSGWPKRYDELPDPDVKGDMKYWKMLIGPRTIYSSGDGSVAEYKRAAIKAGYSAICFTETFEDMSPKLWKLLVKDCADNTDETFVCLPGLDIESYEGQRYLVLGAKRYPSPHWLTADGKRLQAVRMLSLGWFAHVSVVHKPGKGALNSKTYKHYAGIGVATYDSRGRLIDNGMFAYQWSCASDSRPIPIAVHEVTSPGDVRYATEGYQQILPAPTLVGAVDYFRFAFAHAFDAPMRYFISEGPILDGWSMFNKDIGNAEFNRRHLRLGIGVRNMGERPAPITRIKLYDGFELIRNWRNDTPAFHATVDASHNRQHQYLMIATDARGRRVLSPPIRTVCNNYCGRCADRQNWLGTQIVYTGWHSNGLPRYRLRLAGTDQGLDRDTPTILDFPFYSNHVQIQDADMSYMFYGGTMAMVAGDAKGMLPLRIKEAVNGGIRYTYFSPTKRAGFSTMLVEATVTLKQPSEVVAPRGSRINPVFATALGRNNALILPGKKPEQLAQIITPGKRGRQKGNEANAFVSLPVGSYAGGIVPLSAGLSCDGREIGTVTVPGTYPAGTAWKARFLILRNKRFHWRNNIRLNTPANEFVDDKAEQALSEMGFRGRLPYRLELTQGRLEKVAYFAHLTAANGGVAGRCVNTSGRPMLMYVPFLITGLDDGSEMIVWRSDTAALDPFAAFEGKGYVSFDADKTVDFYAGNAAVCDPRLVVSMVIWDADTAWFRVHNPTTADITSDFTTASAVKVFKQVRTRITVPAGTSVEIK